MTDGQAPRRSTSRSSAALLGLGATLAVLLAGCTGTTDPSAVPHPPTAPSTVTPAPTATRPGHVAVRLNPADGAQDVNPVALIQVTVTGGTISALTLTNAQGTQVSGQLTADRRGWTGTEPLGYGKTYTWTGTATGTDGATVPIHGSFHTLRPARQVSAELNVGDGQTYGVAMPIAVHFSVPVTDRAAVQRALSVRTSVPTTGSWAWLDSQDVHWRPQNYCQPGTSIMITAKLYGVQSGPGVFGRADISASFTIGRSQIVRANTRTHRGEFIHAAPWSVAQQGRSNVSHGCVNLSTANALAYYNSVLPGDPVEITGSAVPLGPSDGDYYDWTLSWSQWHEMSGLSE